MRRLNIILLFIAAIFLFVMLRKIGWSDLGRYLGEVGYCWPLILVPYGVANLLGAAAWKLLLVTEGAHPSLGRLFFLRLAGESLNQLTPTAYLGGEPFKALRLDADGIPWQDATVSLVIQKGLLALSLALYISLSIALVPFVLPGAHLHLGFLSLGVAALGVVGVSFVVLQRKNPCTCLLRLLKRFGLSPALVLKSETDLTLLDAKLAVFIASTPAAAFSVIRRLREAFWLLLGLVVVAMEK